MKDSYTYLICYWWVLTLYLALLLKEDSWGRAEEVLVRLKIGDPNGQQPVLWAATAANLPVNLLVVSIGLGQTSPKNLLDTFLASTSFVLLAFISAWPEFFIW